MKKENDIMNWQQKILRKRVRIGQMIRKKNIVNTHLKFRKNDGITCLTRHILIFVLLFLMA